MAQSQSVDSSVEHLLRCKILTENPMYPEGLEMPVAGVVLALSKRAAGTVQTVDKKSKM